MIDKATLDFLKALKKNNSKEWFDKNKHTYLVAKTNIDNMAEKLIKSFSTFDKRLSNLEPKDCVFRIYRDIRFSKNKTPYKTNMGCAISPGGRKAEEAGFYIHIEPG